MTTGTPSRRSALLERVARDIPLSADESCVLVAVDGPDGSGKTVFADQLAQAVMGLGRPVIRISADDFHHPRAVRYRRGRDSPTGFWLDSYDYERLTADVLDPLSPGGDHRYRPAAHDLETDETLDPQWRTAPAGAVVLLDGLFLHRAELADRWRHSIYLDVAPEVTASRMALRDNTHPDPAHPSMRRYAEAQRIYARERSPRERATVVVDNTDFERPRLIRNR